MLYLEEINNYQTGKTFKFSEKSSPVFKILANNKEINDWTVISEATSFPLLKDIASPSNGKHFSGKGLSVVFESKTAGIRIVWKAELRQGAGYIRTLIDIKSITEQKKTINYISLIQGLPQNENLQVHNNSLGLPVVDTYHNLFWGMEVPFFKVETNNKRKSLGFHCHLDLKQSKTYSFSAVVAVFSKKQLRRSLLHYIERERARSYEPLLNYNCWFDLERSVSEKGMLNRIKEINNQLTEKRGVPVDAYVIDDGYDDWNEGFWVFNKKKFPNGFKPLAREVKDLKSNLGVWISPAAGYGRPRNDRIKRAKELGITSLDLSDSKYYKWFLNKTFEFVHDDKMVYLKWDRLGSGVSNHFMALMNIATKLRKINPKLFINTTVGTWQSPFWLQQVDCTWRGKSDMGFMGKGDNREQWLTYRDAVTYDAIKSSNFIYPVNAIMNHGVVFANGHDFARKALKGTKDIRNDVRIYFAGGYALQELYITPEILNTEQWDAIAQAVSWANKNENILVDSHFIGGDPNKLEVYGFAAWQDNKGTIAFRNPLDANQSIEFDIKELFELPPNSKMRYHLITPYKDQRIKSLEAIAGKKNKLLLRPFEVLVFNAK
jgi:hypothetical protein